MTFLDFIACLVQFLVFIPSAFLCYIPMKNHLRYNFVKIIIINTLMFSVLIPICSGLVVFFHIDGNIVLLPLLFIFFIVYNFTLKINISCSFTIFCDVCALMAFPSNFAYAFDAILHPHGNSIEFSWEAGLFQLGLTFLIVALVAYPVYRWGGKLIDSLCFPKIWTIALFFPIIFWLLCMVLIPHKYETLHINNIYPMYFMIFIIIK